MSARPRLGREEWAYALRRTGHAVIRTRVIDSAAALTFFSAIVLFPAALATLSAFAFGGGDGAAVRFVQQVVDEVADEDAVVAVRGPLEQLTGFPVPGLTLAFGLLLTLWTGSAYASAFGRATNTFYGVQEGRRIWKFRGLMLVVAAVLVAGLALAVPLVVGTPRVARASAEVLGVGEPWVALWLLARAPLLFVLATALIAVLYYWTPTVVRESAGLYTWGSVFALVGWTATTALFVFYVTEIAHYGEVYGWVGGALVLLLWLYLSNFVLLVGAALDAELLRVRQLLDGLPAESVIKVPLRDSSRNLVIARSLAADEADGRRIRERADERRHRAAKHL